MRNWEIFEKLKRFFDNFCVKFVIQIYRDASGRAYVSRGRPHQGRNGEIDDVSKCPIVIKCHFLSFLAR